MGYTQEGQNLNPEKFCECTDQCNIDSLYPDWATAEDKQEYWELGMARAAARPEGQQSWRVCPKEDFASMVDECYSNG